MYLWTRLSGLKNKGQDYRALAEGLRVACAWRRLGVSNSVSACYLIGQPEEARWIRYALAAFERIARPNSTADHRIEPRDTISDTIRYWVRPQWEYYVGAWRSVHFLSKSCERIAKVMIFVSIALALSLFIAKTSPATIIGSVVSAHFDLILILSSASAVAAALAHNFIEKRAWREHARRYSRMSRLLEDTIERLDPLDHSAPHPDDAICLLRGVAQEELDENSEWLQTFRDRPLEFPHLG
jgi:hypothetical protein